jgi:hypothetical protein
MPLSSFVVTRASIQEIHHSSAAMASSSSTPIINPLTDQTIFKKLTKNNHALWKMQVLAIIRGVNLEGYLTGDTLPPASTIRILKNPDDKEETDGPNPDL